MKDGKYFITFQILVVGSYSDFQQLLPCILLWAFFESAEKLSQNLRRISVLFQYNRIFSLRYFYQSLNRV